MSDMSSGARAPDYPVAENYPAAYPVTDQYPDSSGADDSTARQVAGQTKEAAGQAASEVKDTAKEQAQRVGAEARTQVRNVASDVRGKVSDQARTQNDKLVGTIRDTAAQLDEMRGGRGDSPAAAVVSRVADGGRQIADYLDRNGPEGVLREVQDFARRRPGAFLATALAAGFVVGRLGKGVAKADPDAGEAKPAGDAFVSTTAPQPAYPATGYVEPGYASSTDYASTGTGTPVVVEEEFVFENPERRP